MAGIPEFRFDLLPTRPSLPALCCYTTHRFLRRRFGVSRNLLKLNATESIRALAIKNSSALINMASNQTDDAGAAFTADTEHQPGVVVTDLGNIEEGRDAYRSGGFHPVYIGDMYASKYQVMSKIGYGRYSTVWLVKDLSKP